MAKILLVDDEAELLDLYKDYLVGTFYEIETANDGAAALDKLKAGKFDLVVTDLNMPGMTGQALIRELQKSPVNNTCPVLVCSAHITAADTSEFGPIGRIEFLPKPMRKEMMLAKIAGVLARRAQVHKIPMGFVTPFIDAAAHVFLTMTSSAVSPLAPYLRSREEVSGDISSIISITGKSVRGTASLSFDQGPFLWVVNKMLGMEFDKIDAENKDAVAELLNMIFGHARKTLNQAGHDIAMARPAIITGKGHIVDHPTHNLPTTVVPLKGKELAARLEINLQGGG